MGDWVTVMEDFRNIVLKETSKTDIRTPKTTNIQLTLLRNFAQTVSSQKKAKISTNFLAAAMHLAFLKSAVQNKLVVELPDDPLALAQRFASFTLEGISLTLKCSIITTDNQLDDEDMEFLKEYAKSTIKGPGFAGLRNPLHIALGLTPLCLLLPQSFSKKHVNRKTLTQVGVMNTTFWIWLTNPCSVMYSIGKWKAGAPVRNRKAGLADIVPDGGRL